MLRMGKISYTGVEFCSINMNTAWDSDTSTFSQELPLQLELAHEKKGFNRRFSKISELFKYI